MTTAHPPEAKAEALALYVEVGPTEAARRTGIPKGTINRWAKAAGATTEAHSAQTQAATEAAAARAAQLREDLRVKMLEKAHDALCRMDEPHRDYRNGGEIVHDRAPSGAMKDYAMTTAILLDKYRLEVGESTSRSEVHSVSDLDREIRGLMDDLAGGRQTAAAGDTASRSVETNRPA